MKAKIAFALLWVSLGLSPAFAAEENNPCPSIYGTWYSAYVVDRRGIPDAFMGATPDDIVMEARVSKDKTILIWPTGRKETFYMWTERPQDAYNFTGVSKKGRYVSMRAGNLSGLFDRKYFKYDQYNSCLLNAFIREDTFPMSTPYTQVVMRRENRQNKPN